MHFLGTTTTDITDKAFDKFNNPKRSTSQSNKLCFNYVVSPFHSSLSKSLKFYSILASKSSLNLSTKSNSLFLKDPVSTENRRGIYFNPCPISSVTLDKKEADWNTGLMSVLAMEEIMRFLALLLLPVTCLMNIIFDFSKTSTDPSIFSSHRDFRQDCSILKNFINFVNDPFYNSSHCKLVR